MTFILTSLSAQIKIFDLKKSNCQLYKGQVFAYGLISNIKNDVLSIYKLNDLFIVTDSAQIEISKNKTELYLQLYSDTLYDFINIYVQKEGKNTVSIFRFNFQLDLITSVNNIDIARLNNTSLFDANAFRFNEDVYSVKIIRDTSGKQFYVNKFSLKSKEGNFEYALKWQFPFERKNVENAKVFYVNKNFALVFVIISEGIKKGQWILKLNSVNGQLIKATKINEKGDTDNYFYGNHYYDPLYKSIVLIGHQYKESQYDLSKNVLKTEDASFIGIYFMEYDSIGDLKHRQNFNIPVTTVSSGAKKISSSYGIKFEGIKKTSDGKLVIKGDIYKSTNRSKCFLYVNSSLFNLIPAENGYALEKNSITTNRLIEDYFFSKDQLDLNGKLCMDSLSQFPELFYNEPGLPVKKAFKIDSEKNAVWLLCKHSFNKNNVNYSLLSPVKKIYQITSVDDISENKSPGLLTTDNDQYVIFQQVEEGKFQLKLYQW